jgi:hypothetical protein
MSATSSTSTTRVVLGNSFADLPAALMLLGRDELAAGVSASALGDAPTGTAEPTAMSFTAPAARDIFCPQPDAANADAVAPVTALPAPSWSDSDGSDADGLRAIVEQLACAASTLDALIARDREQKEAALQQLERYDAAVAGAAEAQALLARAAELHGAASGLAAEAIGDDVRAAAQAVADTAGRAVEQATRWASERTDEVTTLESAPHVQRALAERVRRAEAARQAEAAEQALERCRDALATARVAADAGWLDEARGEPFYRYNART